MLTSPDAFFSVHSRPRRRSLAFALAPNLSFRTRTRSLYSVAPSPALSITLSHADFSLPGYLYPPSSILLPSCRSLHIYLFPFPLPLFRHLSTFFLGFLSPPYLRPSLASLLNLLDLPSVPNFPVAPPGPSSHPSSSLVRAPAPVLKRKKKKDLVPALTVRIHTP